MTTATELAWWGREDLAYDSGRLRFAGQFTDDVARECGTPTFAYHPARVALNAERIRTALDDAGFDGRHQVYFAMKANRFAPLLTWLKTTGLVGIDACSPNEVQHAVSCGFRPHETSLTATNLSNDDLQRAARFEGLRINLDSISAIRRWGEIKPGSTIGLRVNPAAGVSRAGNDKLQYCSHETTKFGIYREQFHEALQMCAEFDLAVETVHFHTGCGYLTDQLPQWSEVLRQSVWFIDQIESLRTVNIGGGLGVPHLADEQPLDLAQWASVLASHFGSRSLNIEVEPGDYLVKDAGILLLTVNTVEMRRSKLFAGVDAGFNIATEPATYSLPFEPVPLRLRGGKPKLTTIAGNINEALDIFYDDILLPPIFEGDQLALINAGAYSASMASNHCMRGGFNEVLLIE